MDDECTDCCDDLNGQVSHFDEEGGGPYCSECYQDHKGYW